MKHIKNIIFDFDGTLVDTAPLIVKTMQAAIEELSLPEKTDEECRATIGLRLEEIPMVLWGLDEIQSAIFAKVYRRIFNDLKKPDAAQCFPGVTEGLQKLYDCGYGLAIASSRSSKSLDEYVNAFGWNKVLSAVLGGNDVVHGKPAPDAVLNICKKLDWNANDCLVVGDAVYDIMMGRNAGSVTCGVSYGNHDRDKLNTAKPDFIVDSFEELVRFILS
ncbi:MAG: HAD family hydrolase [Paramuribaculum sp.]|nr:HAD family hydrolase [Paramuribaculum sp.]